MKKQISKHSGFTLLEMIIVLTILSFMTINIAINLQNAFKARAKVQGQVEAMSRVRDALKVIERDINLAFHYRDLEEELRQEIKKAKTALIPGQAQQTQQPFPGAPPGVFAPNNPNPQTEADPAEITRKQNRLDPTTQFIGKDNSLYFVTLNTNRLNISAVRADFVKVGYLKRSCRPPGSDKTSECIFRVESSYAEGDITKGGDETFLIANVTEFGLKYLGRGKQEWSSDWSTKADEAASKGNYPLAVEITIATETTNPGGKPRKVSMQIVGGVHFPNNGEEKKTGTPGG